jgi:seryl-tRNA synthetase
MLQVNVLRQKTDWVKERLAIKNFKQPELIDEIIALDDERKKLQAEFDLLQSKINSSSKNIGKLMATGNKDEAEQLKASVVEWKASIEPVKHQSEIIEKKLSDKLVLLPNLPHQSVSKLF